MSTFPATNSNEAVELIIDGGNQLHQIINEDATSEIQTESGPIPSVRKALADTFLFLEPIPWQQGSDEISFNQLRTFDNNIYWAPTASLLTPVPMGATPEGDTNWKLAPVDVSREYFNVRIDDFQSAILGQDIFKGDNGEYVENGDTIPSGTTYLQIQTTEGLRVVTFSPLSSGSLTDITEVSATVGGTPVEFSLANHISLITVDDMINNLGLKENDYVSTHKFNTFINQKWLIVASDDPLEFTLPLANGLYAKEISDIKYFESFGAYADGATLDDTAFEFARSYQGKVEGKGDYLISQLHPLTNGTKWYGKWSKISAQGSNQLFTFGDNVRFGEFELDGLNGAHTAYPTQILSPSVNVELGDLIYRNFSGVIANFQTYPLNIPMYGASNFKVGNVIFYDITQEDDGVVTGPGFVGGVYLVGLDSEVINGQSYGKVGDVYGFTIKSVDTGSGVTQDSDLIRVFAETADTNDFNITFGNVYGRNVYKRLVKAASCGGLNFGDVYSFNPDDGIESYTLHSAVEVLGTGFNMKFGDIKVEGPSSRVVWFKGKGNQSGNIYDGAGCQAVIFGGPSEPCVSSQVGDIVGRGLNNNSQQGTAVTLYNASQCQAGDITGLFSSALITNPENTGSNSVGNIVCPARVSTLNGSTTINSINADIQGTTVAGSHYSFGENTKLKSAEIITDGRVTISISGSGVDVDLGRTRIVRATASNGVESNHSIFTTASALNGIVRGKLEIEVNASVSGTPTGASGKTLAYMTGLNVDDFDLSMNITSSIRGATGFNYWLDNVDGQINRIAVKSLTDSVGSQLTGKLGVTKLENLVPNTSTVTCSGEVNIFLIEKETTSVVTGENNSPVVVNSTR